MRGSQGTAMGGGASERLHIEVLGPVSVRRGTTSLDAGPVRRQAVLVALVLRRSGPVSYEQLLDDVWGTHPPESGHRVLPSYVFALRKALDPQGAGPRTSVIRGGGGGYRFVLANLELDTAELEAHTQAARRAKDAGDLATATDRFTAALALFRGEPLAGLPGPFAQGERQLLTERRGVLQAGRLECLVGLGRAGDALDELAMLTAADPLNEPLLGLRMRALYAVERQDEALKAFVAMRVRLADELGVDPGKQLQRVHEAVLRRDDAFLLGSAPTRSARPRRPVNDLPGSVGHIDGRTHELNLLTTPAPSDTVSLTTVDGTAGVGKTTLVLHAARQLRTDYPDGCLYADLRAHSEEQQSLTPQRVLHRLLRSLGEPNSEALSDLDELTAAWRTATSSLRLLLVLDDVANARQAAPLLPAGPGSRVLITSRRRLVELDADLRITLEPLEAGGAVSLLRHLVGEERADSEPEAMGELARLCDGLPLALRIVGARLQTRPTWTPAFLVERMAGDEDRLAELSAGDRSVEAAFRLSYDQLPQQLQHGFRVLGLTPTTEVDKLASAAMLGCPPAEAENVLEGLVDVSLLQQPAPGRYRFHDLVRAHARRLARTTPEEHSPARTALLRLYLDAGRLASDWGPGGFPTGPQPVGAPFSDWQHAERWLDAAGTELPDVVTHAAELGEADHACWIAEALTDCFLRRGHYHECRTTLGTALACAGEATDRRMPPALRSSMGMIDLYQGRLTEGHTWFTTALEISRQNGETREEARALAGLGAVAFNLGRGEDAIPQLTTALNLSERVGDSWLTGMTLSLLGSVHHHHGRIETALDCFGLAYTYAETSGRPNLLSQTLYCIGDVHLSQGRHREAYGMFRRALDQVAQNAHTFQQAFLLARLGTAQETTDLDSALSLHHEALALHEQLDPLKEPHYDRLEMDIRCRLGQTYATAGLLHEGREQYLAALAIPGAETHTFEYARAEAGLATCQTA
ncbi:AfsR/SARP family transcriptional regulator [Streptomyces atratus]|uniref:DNA-binding transcriptional activator of the SARP family n=2 Tax=Streptomyces atratus TaxID=1893 RepID=A0A1K2F893_STRAR|nr:BTAD domain-containing putative transcriptional regulator [Streptomyces atratus]SFY43253.1 DNA-binding transcriptional activator of the SARP family [Streptomyces atratus]